MRNPGMAGLTSDRLGDAIPWKPAFDPAQGTVPPKSQPSNTGGDDESG